MNRRDFLKVAGAAGALPLFNIGCAGFGRSRLTLLADGANARIAIVGCGDWGRTLLKRAGKVGGCELVALCEPDPNAIEELYRRCGNVWSKQALGAARVYPDYRVMFDEIGDTFTETDDNFRGPHLYVLERLGVFRNRLTRNAEGKVSNYEMTDLEKLEVEQRMRYCGLLK